MIDARFDIAIIGGGIIGLSVGMEARRRYPHLKLAVLEKEERVARHQSGHNSGVVHSGIYYKPGSLKARLCVQGAAEMMDFCQAHRVPYKICGKVIVATTEAELPRLDELEKRGIANGIPKIIVLRREELRGLEPHCAGIRALHVPGTGITDYGVVAQKYAETIASNGGQVITAAEVIAIFRRDQEIVMETKSGSFASKYVVNCAGLHSDRLSIMSGERASTAIIPFRGEYYELAEERQHLVKGLIYPVPDPELPFLGVHFTRRVQGGVEAGPNAVLAFSREGYRKTDYNSVDVFSMLAFPGFWHMAKKHWRTAIAEFHRSFSKKAFVFALKKLVPELQVSDLKPGGSGVRAQAVHRDGSLVDDFVFKEDANMLHVLNVPSPAATASIPIGRFIVQMMSKRFDPEQGKL